VLLAVLTEDERFAIGGGFEVDTTPPQRVDVFDYSPRNCL